MEEVQSKSLNGINVDQLVGTIEAIKENSEIALFKFRSQTEWVRGGHCRTRIKDFYGATQEDTSRAEPFIMHGDEPAVLLGEDHGPNAVEAVLHALASCLSVGIVYNAAAMGIEVRALNFQAEGEIDLHGFLGLSDEIRPGYKNISMHIDLESDASEEQLKGLLDHVRKTSPVLDIVSNPVPVELSLN